MTTLTQRPRVRGLIERIERRASRLLAAPSPLVGDGAAEPDSAHASGASAQEHPPAPEPPREPEHDPQPEPLERFARTPPLDGLQYVRRNHATARLYERLSVEEVANVRERIREVPELEAYYSAAPDDATRQHLVLTYGSWLDVPGLHETTGLERVQPPEDIHAMARGPLAAGGGLYEADIMVDALQSAGVDMAQVHSAIDFGCSSGRVVRVLAAAYPEIDWRGCDPNAPAIAWASENLPGIDFFVNADCPPLPLEQSSLDLSYAISIWSHFAPGLGLRWFEEMHRLIRPGGHLVCTTHGLTSAAFYARLSLRTPEQCDEILRALYRDGHWYAPEFGDEGDWGVRNPHWGTAFLSPEWLLTQLCPRWRVLEFAPARNQENQDLYVLERV